MPGIFVFSEQDRCAFELLSKAGELGKKMGLDVAAAALGDSQAEEYARRGCTRVYTSSHALLRPFDASVYAQTLSQIAAMSQAKVILIGSTRSGKELAGRLAQMLGAGCLTDCQSLEYEKEGLVATRNAFGGATVAVQKLTTGIQIYALMPYLSKPAAPGETAGEVVQVNLDLKPSRIKKLKKTPKDLGAVDIEGAEVLVCVGKGLAKQEDVKIAAELASALGGFVACTKPLATDLKWLPESRIIGLSGKKGKPNLAVCAGISGQVQFAVGIRDAKTIVAVNTDPNAYIFQIADYGLIGDLYQILPQLTAALKNRTKPKP
jgi:electron transfer flavoprotein alpha subunit